MNYFGIDVHSTYHKVIGVTASGATLEMDFENTPGGHEQLRELLSHHSPCSVAMEACTGSYFLYDILEPVCQTIRLLHPADFRARFPRKHRKNDRIDAEALCEAIKYNMKGIWVADEIVRQHRALASKRVAFTQRRTQSKNSLQSTLRDYCIPVPKNCWSAPGREELRHRIRQLPDTVAIGAMFELETVEHYDHIIEQLDWRMAELASKDPNIQLLMSIPGINYHAAFVIISEIGDISRFADAKHLAAYAGICPRLSQSGASAPRHGSITKKGRSRLRWIAVECASTAVRFAPKLKKLYWRIKKRTGSAGKAKVAAGRKLLELCYHILKSGRPYSENVEAKHEAKLRKMDRVAKKSQAA